MEFKNFNEFYNKGYELAIIAKQNSFNSKEAITYARKNFNKVDLNSFYTIGNLNEEQCFSIHAKTTEIKFSLDNLIKNILEHSELGINEYKNIQNYLNSAEYILKKSNKNLIYFKINNRIYQIVIKCTQNANELFVTTFHIASMNQLNKDIIRYENIKKDSSDYEDSNYPSVT